MIVPRKLTEMSYVNHPLDWFGLVGWLNGSSILFSITFYGSPFLNYYWFAYMIMPLLEK